MLPPPSAAGAGPPCEILKITTATGAEPVLVCQGVGKRYGSHWVLRDVHLTIPPGTAWALVGVNGAGKSTLLKCVLDLVRPDAGMVRLLGRSSRDYRARQGVAYLPERFSPPDDLTPLSFWRRMARLQGLTFDETLWLALAQHLDLPERRCRDAIRTLSKGMTQKVGLVSCLAGAQPLLVLDEPMSGLDPLARRQVARILREKRAQGHTLLLNTHLLHDAADICSHLGILHEGRLVYAGELHAAPGHFHVSTLEQAYLRAVTPLHPDIDEQNGSPS
ncbi:MAG: ABC transporter ATP-binding protein [Magnetococcus sp. WYHC-3]